VFSLPKNIEEIVIKPGKKNLLVVSEGEGEGAAVVVNIRQEKDLSKY
jgi:hypothetical protein